MTTKLKKDLIFPRVSLSVSVHHATHDGPGDLAGLKIKRTNSLTHTHTHTHIHILSLSATYRWGVGACLQSLLAGQRGDPERQTSHGGVGVDLLSHTMSQVFTQVTVLYCYHELANSRTTSCRAVTISHHRGILNKTCFGEKQRNGLSYCWISPGYVMGTITFVSHC